MSKEEILKALSAQKGIIFARPAIVARSMYRGRNIIATNKTEQDVDERGYFPVEWWIMSLTPAENDVRKEGEGLSTLLVNGSLVPFKAAVGVAENELLGKYMAEWPLTKILDIGGTEVIPSFCDCNAGGKGEVPPIPCHIHSGYTIRNDKGELIHKKPGKLEAYFFPPLNVAPYKDIVGDLSDVITRLGLKPTTTKDDVVGALKRFGADDSFYELMKQYPIQSFEGWTIRQGVLHAPGPYPTFEIQFAQDDSHLASWTLGTRLEGDRLTELRTKGLLRGMLNEEEWVEKLVEWDMCTDTSFKERFYRPIKVLEGGEWGRRFQIFFDEFYGEGFEVLPGSSMTRAAGGEPFAGIVWSGRGTINGNAVDVTHNDKREFLVVPNTLVDVTNTGADNLYIFTVFPLRR